MNNSDNEEEVESGPDYNYILSMPIYNLTKEKKEELCKKRDEKVGICLGEECFRPTLKILSLSLPDPIKNKKKNWFCRYYK